VYNVALRALAEELKGAPEEEADFGEEQQL
jgi:hypothetical protein